MDAATAARTPVEGCGGAAREEGNLLSQLWKKIWNIFYVLVCVLEFLNQKKQNILETHDAEHWKYYFDLIENKQKYLSSKAAVLRSIAFVPGDGKINLVNS